MSTFYTIRAKDPSGEFVSTLWFTQHLPRVGETVLLPEQQPGQWQEMTVVAVEHHPNRTEVWLGGAIAWEPGSVARLFKAADDYRTFVASVRPA